MKNGIGLFGTFPHKGTAEISEDLVPITLVRLKQTYQNFQTLGVFLVP